MSKQVTKDVANAYRAMGRKLYQKRGAHYAMTASQRGCISYRERWQASHSDLSFDDWLKEQGLKPSQET